MEPNDLSTGDSIDNFTLVSTSRSRVKDFSWNLTFPLANAYRILVSGLQRSRPPHDNVRVEHEYRRFEIISLDPKTQTAVFSFPTVDDKSLSGLQDASLELRLNWSKQIVAEVWKRNGDDKILSDLAARSYGLTEHGMIRHYQFDRTRIHLGLGERGAPIDLTGRAFEMHATDAAWYDSYRTDPLYKHTPFLISVPRPDQERKQGLTFGIFQASNSAALWDVGNQVDFPSGGFSMSFTQDWGGLEEWVMVGKGLENVVQTFAELAGKPKLVGRDWLGYLASTMLLSDEDNAQEQLSRWPAECKQNGIPCSGMHLSSGYTTDQKSGERWVFHMNKHRYPDFKGMLKVYHEAGMKVVPNVKPYILQSHPAYEMLKEGGGLFFDPITGGPAVQNLWASKEGFSKDGSWVDMTAPSSRQWWAEGVKSLIKLGVDGMWDDNSEYFTRDDELLFKNQFDHSRAVTVKGATRTGLMGRLTGNEMMNKVSHDTLVKCNPERRPYVLTRSGNVAAFQYACSTWSGDNETSWHNMRGSQHIQLNASLSLMQSYGSDVGGFCGDLPTPELFVRWVQLGVTHSRFSIHSNSRTKADKPKLTLPWMYPEVLPIIRDTIKWRYEMLPYLNNLMWRSHLHTAPSNAPLFYGPFSTDPVLYTKHILEGFDAWLGVGQLLVAPALFKGMTTREVYFPRSSQAIEKAYFDMHAPYGKHKAGTWTTIATPLAHHGLFAREGALIPIGKSCVTVTTISGSALTHVDGVATVLESEGGVVELDDWRGVLIFPGSDGETETGFWIEDDGISADPARTNIEVHYLGAPEKVIVSVKVVSDEFEPLWMDKLHVILPVGDNRTVIQMRNGKLNGDAAVVSTQWKDRKAWVVYLA